MSPIIDDIKVLKMDPYLDCLLDDKLGALGEGAEEELQAAWEKIKLQCAEYSETMEYKYYEKSTEHRNSIALGVQTGGTVFLGKFGVNAEAGYRYLPLKGDDSKYALISLGVRDIRFSQTY